MCRSRGPVLAPGGMVRCGRMGLGVGRGRGPELTFAVCPGLSTGQSSFARAASALGELGKTSASWGEPLGAGIVGSITLTVIPKLMPCFVFPLPTWLSTWPCGVLPPSLVVYSGVRRMEVRGS